MKKKIIVLLFIITTIHNLYAQDTLGNGKAFSLPSEKYGISFGNSYEFTGIRINLADENVREINGINITFWYKQAKNMNSEVNGLTLGILPACGSLQPVNLGLLGVGGAKNMYGLSITAGAAGAGGNIRGLALGGLFVWASGRNSDVSGINVAGLGVVGSSAVNGIAFGGIAVGSDGDINGVTSSVAYITSGATYRGIGITAGYLDGKIFDGIAVAGYSETNQMNGLSIALFNNTKELHGVQVGLLNHAENNTSLFKWLPFVNLNFSK